MTKFWKWMSHKKYGSFVSDNSYDFVLSTNIKEVPFDFKNPPKQMLIGYMIEYIKEQQQKAGSWMVLYVGNIMDEIINSKNLYKDLKSLIKEIE